MELVSFACQINGTLSKKTFNSVLNQSVWNKQERVRRAIKALAMTYLAAILGLFIPLLHLILPTTLLIAGPIIFYFKFNEKGRIEIGKILCPHCNQEFEILPFPLKFPKEYSCDHCTETRVSNTNFPSSQTE